MKKFLGFTRWLIAAATTLHIKGLKATVAAADRRTDAAIDAEAQANRVKMAAQQDHIAARKMVDEAVNSASAIYQAAKAEIAALRPSAALSI